MKIKLVLLCMLALGACKSKLNTANDCGNIICTKIFISIPVKLISTQGKSISYKTYKVINKDTGNEIKSKSDYRVNDPNSTNTIILVDDGHLHELSEKGTDLQLQLTLDNEKVIKTDYKVSGGKCACHVAKLSGPDQIDIDQL